MSLSNHVKEQEDSLKLFFSKGNLLKDALT